MGILDDRQRGLLADEYGLAPSGLLGGSNRRDMAAMRRQGNIAHDLAQWARENPGEAVATAVSMSPAEPFATMADVGLSAKDVYDAVQKKDWWGAAQSGALGLASAAVPFLGYGAVRAYHGSPHDFDKFSMDRIGTGEGAQAYGHGLYFAENEAIAKTYRDALSAARNLGVPKTRMIGSAIPKHEREAVKSAYESALSSLRAAGVENLTNWRPWRSYHDYYNQRNQIGDLDEAYMRENGDRVEARIAENERRWLEDPVFRKSVRDFFGNDEKPDWGWLRQPFSTAYASAGRSMNSSSGGHVYTVDIDADPEDFLDWDLPLSEQPEKVRGAFLNSDEMAEAKNIQARLDNDLLAQLGVSDGGSALSVEKRKELESALRAFTFTAETRGERAYQNMVEQGNRSGAIGEHLGPNSPPIKTGPRAASDALRARGVKGIRYKDAASRGKDGGTYNYVVFDDALVDIKNKE